MSKYGVTLSVNVWFLEIHFTIFKKRIISRKNHRIPRIINMLRHNRKLIRNLNLTLSYRWKLKVSSPSDYKFDLRSMWSCRLVLPKLTPERPRLFDMRLPSTLVGINLGPRQLSENPAEWYSRFCPHVHVYVCWATVPRLSSTRKIY